MPIRGESPPDSGSGNKLERGFFFASLLADFDAASDAAAAAAAASAAPAVDVTPPEAASPAVAKAAAIEDDRRSPEKRKIREGEL